MKDKDTPLRLVRKWAKMDPGCYEALDRCRQAKGNGMMWPDWCELPIAAAYTYLVSQHGCDYMEAAELAAELTACWIWRQSKILYAFDADLAAVLAAQADDFEDTDVLPSVLFHVKLYIARHNLFVAQVTHSEHLPSTEIIR